MQINFLIGDRMATIPVNYSSEMIEYRKNNKYFIM